MEISERTAMETAKAVRAWAEEGTRWMFRVGAQRDWFTFAGVVAGLWVLSKIGAYFDLLTLVYIGNRSINIFLILFQYPKKIPIMNVRSQFSLLVNKLSHKLQPIPIALILAAVVSGMTAPPLYVRHEDKITQLREKMKTRSRRLYQRVDEKVVRKIKRRFQAKEETKEKKTD